MLRGTDRTFEERTELLDNRLGLCGLENHSDHREDDNRTKNVEASVQHFYRPLFRRCINAARRNSYRFRNWSTNAGIRGMEKFRAFLEHDS